MTPVPFSPDSARASSAESLGAASSQVATPCSGGALSASAKSLAGTMSTNSRMSFHVGDDEDSAHKVDPQEPPQWLLVVVSSAICLNSLQLGVSAQYPKFETLWYVFDFFFTCIWVTEASYKLYLFRLAYFKVGWNRVDFALAICAVADTWIMPLWQLVSDSSEGANGLTGLQVVRLLRLLRVLRMVRLVETRPELHAIVEGLLGAVRALVWALLFLFLIIYAGAVFCMTVIEKDDLTDETGDGDFYFGGIGKSMLTLFNMCILAEWQEIVRPIANTSPLLLVFFIGFISVTSFGVLNLVIGVIADRTLQASQESQKKKENQKKMEKIRLLNEMTETIFEHNDDGQLGLTELQELLEGGHMNDLLKTLMEVGLPRGVSIPELHLMFDLEYEGQLSKTEFSDGLYGMIFNDEFQRDCMSQLAFGQLKKMVAENRTEIMGEVKQLRSDVNTILELLRPKVISAASCDVQQKAVLCGPGITTLGAIKPSASEEVIWADAEPPSAPASPPAPAAVEAIKEPNLVPYALEFKDEEDPGFGIKVEIDVTTLPGEELQAVTALLSTPDHKAAEVSSPAPDVSAAISEKPLEIEELLPPVRAAYDMLPPIQWAMFDKLQAMMVQLRDDLREIPAETRSDPRSASLLPAKGQQARQLSRMANGQMDPQLSSTVNAQSLMIERIRR
eukprot:TRINITY_DN180_c0_g1_i1.p1 TRINITY_DN180_c0_g1~~TRINITY_DN180_c0_g1_i1.p1  ORF type:complete len:676 (+),score=135.22 TRINITY_DN180_c0_g1_i1:146-2173(+)